MAAIEFGLVWYETADGERGFAIRRADRQILGSHPPPRAAALRTRRQGLDYQPFSKPGSERTFGVCPRAGIARSSNDFRRGTMAQREFIETIRLSGAPQAVEIYGEVGEPAEGLTGSHYTGYQARCGCGAEEHCTSRAEAIAWAERHIDEHADEGGRS